MDISNWVRSRRNDIRRNGTEGVRRGLHDIHTKLLSELLPRVVDASGMPIYDRDWDVLLILDACRLDLMREVLGEYEFLSNISRIRSVGSSSKEWMESTFTPAYREEMRDTILITGNPFSAEVLDPNAFQRLDETWRYVWDDDLQTIPARPITDRLITAWRDERPERLIGHYMQPHAAFVPSPIDPGPDERDIWRAIMRGRVSREEVWRAYRENLRYVLNDVALLLENVDADKVVLTADHGNAVGEFGVYGHPNIPISPLRDVPWVETTAHDTQSYEPEIEHDEIGTDDVAGRLADLGYLESNRGE